MDDAFNTIRRTLEGNIRLFRLFVIFIFFIGSSIIIICLVIYLIGKNQRTFPYTSLGSLGPFGVSFFGYLNYKSKLGVHDVLVEQYKKPSPPSKDILIKRITDNSKFKPLRYK